MRYWIRSCVETHSECQAADSSQLERKTRGPSPGLGPKRLIDLGEMGTLKTGFGLPNQIRIVEMENGAGDDEKQMPGYVAVSYRWPQGDRIQNWPMLTRSTCTQFATGYPAKHLPWLFRDSCAIAMSLGVRYVWIDALVSFLLHMSSRRAYVDTYLPKEGKNGALINVMRHI